MNIRKHKAHIIYFKGNKYYGLHIWKVYFLCIKKEFSAVIDISITPALSRLMAKWGRIIKLSLQDWSKDALVYPNLSGKILSGKHKKKKSRKK